MSGLELRWKALPSVSTRFLAPVGRPEARAVVIGPQGPAGTALGFLHTQASPLDVWVVNHNLGVRPVVNLFSVGGVEMLAEVIHQSANQLRVYFTQPQSGSARCI